MIEVLAVLTLIRSAVLVVAMVTVLVAVLMAVVVVMVVEGSDEDVMSRSEVELCISCVPKPKVSAILLVVRAHSSLWVFRITIQGVTSKYDFRFKGGRPLV
jgi:hypothetical protein